MQRHCQRLVTQITRGLVTIVVVPLIDWVTFMGASLLLYPKCSHVTVRRCCTKVAPTMATLSTVKMETEEEVPRVCNVAVVGDCRHGKSTLIDAIARRERPVEDDGGGSATPSVARTMAEEGMPWHLNLVDTPGFVERAGEVNAALSLVDSAMLVVDCLDGVGLHVERTLHSMMKLGVKPLVFINKLDLAMDEWDAERIYQACFDVVVSVNLQMKRTVATENGRVDPTEGTVLFGSASEGWSFSLQTLGTELAAQFDLDEQQMTKKLWGSWAFDPETGAWDNIKVKPANRAFCDLVMGPLLHLKRKNSQNSGDFRSEMRARYPLRPVVMRTIAQASRKARCQASHSVYDVNPTWPLAVQKRDPLGPLIVYIARMAVAKGGQLVAFGRVLSGQIEPKQDVLVFIPNGMRSSHLESRFTKQCVDQFSAQAEFVGHLIDGDFVPVVSGILAGDLCALTGLESLVRRSSIIITPELDGTHWISEYLSAMSISLPYAIHTWIKPTGPEDRSQVTEALLDLSRANPSVHCYFDGYDDDFFIACITDKQLANCVGHITSVIGATASFTISEPMFFYRETIAAKSSKICTVLSPNRHIKMLCRAEPIEVDSACAEDEAGGIDSVRMWYESTEPSRIRQLVNNSCEVPREDFVREPIIDGFRFTTIMGVLCEEEITDFLVVIDGISIVGMERHWKRSQSLIAMRKAVYACQLLSSPALMEPYLEAELRCPHAHLQACMSVLRHHQCVLANFSEHLNSLRLRIWLRAVEKGTIQQEVGEVTASQVAWQYSLRHFQKLEGDPTDPTTKAGAVVRNLRAWKGLEPDLVPLNRLCEE